MQYEHTTAKEVAPIAGFYDPADDTIFLAVGLSKATAEVVYYHERQHRMCYLVVFVTTYTLITGQSITLILVNLKILLPVTAGP